MDEVEKALSRIRKGKASGIEGIPIELYSSDIKYFTPLLTTLLNTIFDSADYHVTVFHRIILYIFYSHYYYMQPLSVICLALCIL